MLTLGLVLLPGTLNVGISPNVIMGLSPTIPTTSEPIVLATYQLFISSPLAPDTLLTLGPSSPSSVNGDGPALIDETASNLAAFDFTSDLLLNQTFEPTPELYPIPEPATGGLMVLVSGGIFFTRRFFIA